MGAPLVAIFGPTASGKSALAVALAERVGGEIVSCDAMQLYRGLPVLTNQPTAGELARVPHHLVGVWPLEHSGSVHEYGVLARDAVDDVRRRGRVPILCGGSGLYLRAALAGLPLAPRVAPARRRRFETLYDRMGAPAAHAFLAARDEAAAARIHPNDRRRVVRALELHEAGASLAPSRDELFDFEPRLPGLILGLRLPRTVLHDRIAARTGAMFEAGVVEEVRAALAADRLSETAARIHGLDDVRTLLAGAIDETEARRRLEVRTRRYAKRQETWMRRLPGLRPVEADRAPEMLAAELAEAL